MAANIRCVCLADSTGFGLLPPGSRSGLVEAETTLGWKFTAAVSYGASLTAPSGDGKPSLMQLLLQLQQEATVPLSAPVFCGCVPARDSVPPKPGESKEEGFKGLVEGRAQYQIKETTQSIMELVPWAYSGGKKNLHFMKDQAKPAMVQIVETAAQEICQGTAQASAASAQGTAQAVADLQGTARVSTSAAQGTAQAVVVVICCGWNATKTLLEELLCSKALTSSRSWKDVLRTAACFAPNVPFTEVATYLDPVPAVLYQTNFQDSRWFVAVNLWWYR